MTTRFVLVELDVDDWGAVDPAAYVTSRDMRGFMGSIHAEEIVEIITDPAKRQDLLYRAWTVIANAQGWDKDTEWRRAAIRWRDAWHETLSGEARR